MFNLLQDRVGKARDEGITRNKQHRKTVRHRNASRGNHVCCARTDRRGADHDLLTTSSLCESCRGEPHSLLVLSAPHRQFGAVHFERVTQACHVAVAKDSIYTGEERNVLSVDDGSLSDEVSNECFRCCQSNGLIFHLHSLPSQQPFPRSLNPTSQ